MIRMSREAVERRLSKYLSTHSAGQEAYDFNIKIQNINIPNEIRENVSEDEIDSVYDIESRNRLLDFANGILGEFQWIHAWSQQGREGGWLVFYPKDDVFDKYGKVTDLRDAKARLRDLDVIGLRIRGAIVDLMRDMESKAWWTERFPRAFRIPHGVKEWRPPEQ